MARLREAGDAPPTPARQGTLADAARGADRRAWAAVALLFVAALGLRLWGIGFGLPFAYHVDEAISNDFTRAFRESGLRAAGPHFSVQKLLVIAQHVVVEALRPLPTGLLPDPFVLSLNSEPASYAVLARLTSAMFGAATVVPVFLLGRRLWNRQVGLLAALFLSVCFLHVRDSHYGTPDAVVAFFAVTAALACVRLVDRRSYGRYAAAGLAVGIAVGTKLLAWPLFALLAAFHDDDRPRRAGVGGWTDRLWGTVRSPRIWLAAAIGGLVVVASNPQAIFDWPAFYAFWSEVRALGARGGMDRLYLDAPGPLAGYATSLRWAMGGPLLAASLLGTVWALRASAARRLFVFPLLTLVFMVLPGNIFMARYLMSLLPFLLLGAAALVSDLHARAPGGRAARLLVAAGVCALLVAEPLLASVRHDILLTRPDTRTIAKQWIEEHIPADSVIMLEFWNFSPPLASAAKSVPLSTRSYDVLTRGAYGLSDLSDYFGPSKGAATLDDYVGLGVEYIVANSYSWGSRLLNGDEDAAKRSFYRSLDEQAELVATFSPFREGTTVPRVFDETYGPAIHLSRYVRPGPVLKIYRLPAAAGDDAEGAAAAAP